MANTGDQLLREIDEDLRRDQWLGLWRAYGRHVVAAAVVLGLGFVGVVGWREYQESRLASDGHAYWLADRLEQRGELDRAAAGFADLAADGTGGYGLLAGLREARLLALAGDRPAAIAVYDGIAGDGSVDEVYRQLAALYAATLLIDDGDAADLDRRLAPLLGTSSPWRHSAMELQGLLAMRRGDAAAAATVFAALRDDSATPTALRERAGELLALSGDRE